MNDLAPLDAAVRRRSPATMPGFHCGGPPRNKGLRYPADPPAVEEIVTVMRTAGDTTDARTKSASRWIGVRVAGVRSLLFLGAGACWYVLSHLSGNRRAPRPRDKEARDRSTKERAADRKQTRRVLR